MVLQKSSLKSKKENNTYLAIVFLPFSILVKHRDDLMSNIKKTINALQNHPIKCYRVIIIFTGYVRTCAYAYNIMLGEKIKYKRQ